MNKNFTIGSRQVGADAPVFIVAEMSANHLQDYNRALEILHAAKEAGADAIKLQTLGLAAEADGRSKPVRPGMLFFSL